ncbi:hypothetical protein F4827_001686 [Paraburkholderia bannensis]|uniref:Lipase n=1 Tax=Paraburkholderia bannensis TaxID=765414 RepID=A0A7W9TUU7_9BURK|nr:MULTISPECIES: hypothetical protein [Paraburkholderia]MBB3256840.1 hypothetical protein [Paraburkholderia sp. WP4_3_2]MBB6101838.1 hypothetical protein [Paraburkholderia bannensis]
MDFAAILAAARRADAAYVIDAAQSRAAFEALGLHWIGHFKDGDSQAVLSSDAAGIYLSISGTRFSAGKLGDLMDDIDTRPVALGGGVEVTRGAFDGCADIWAWAKAQVPSGTVFNVEGHSLGGWRATYTPLFLPASQIGALHAFEPPKGANLAYYQTYACQLARLVIVGNGADCWFGYPRLDGRWIHRPGEMLHLLPNGHRIIDTAAWPGGLDLGDHDIDLVVSRLAAIVAKPTAAV